MTFNLKAEVEKEEKPQEDKVIVTSEDTQEEKPDVPEILSEEFKNKSAEHMDAGKDQIAFCKESEDRIDKILGQSEGTDKKESSQDGKSEMNSSEIQAFLNQ